MAGFQSVQKAVAQRYLSIIPLLRKPYAHLDNRRDLPANCQPQEGRHNQLPIHLLRWQQSLPKLPLRTVAALLPYKSKWPAYPTSGPEDSPPEHLQLDKQATSLVAHSPTEGGTRGSS